MVKSRSDSLPTASAEGVRFSFTGTEELGLSSKIQNFYMIVIIGGFNNGMAAPLQKSHRLERLYDFMKSGTSSMGL